MIAPGFVDIHTHPSMEPGYKGIREEHGVPEMHMSGLFERLAVFNLDEDGLRASAETAFCEMLMSGVTTVADLSIPTKAGSICSLAAACGSTQRLGMLQHDGMFKIVTS